MMASILLRYDYYKSVRFILLFHIFCVTKILSQNIELKSNNLNTTVRQFQTHQIISLDKPLYQSDSLYVATYLESNSNLLDKQNILSISILNEIMADHLYLINNTKAIDYYISALESYTRLDNYISLYRKSLVYIKIGKTLKSSSPNKSSLYFKKAFNALLNEQNLTTIYNYTFITAIRNLIELDSQKLFTDDKSFSIAIEKIISISDPSLNESISWVLIDIGTYYSNNKNYNDSSIYYKKAYSYLKNSPNTESRKEYLIYVIDNLYYLDMIQSSDKNYSKIYNNKLDNELIKIYKSLNSKDEISDQAYVSSVNRLCEFNASDCDNNLYEAYSVACRFKFTNFQKADLFIYLHDKLRVYDEDYIALKNCDFIVKNIYPFYEELRLNHTHTLLDYCLNDRQIYTSLIKENDKKSLLPCNYIFNKLNIYRNSGLYNQMYEEGIRSISDIIDSKSNYTLMDSICIQNMYSILSSVSADTTLSNLSINWSTSKEVYVSSNIAKAILISFLYKDYNNAITILLNIEDIIINDKSSNRSLLFVYSALISNYSLLGDYPNVERIKQLADNLIATRDPISKIELHSYYCIITDHYLEKNDYTQASNYIRYSNGRSNSFLDKTLYYLRMASLNKMINNTDSLEYYLMRSLTLSEFISEAAFNRSRPVLLGQIEDLYDSMDRYDLSKVIFNQSNDYLDNFKNKDLVANRVDNLYTFRDSTKLVINNKILNQFQLYEKKYINSFTKYFSINNNVFSENYHSKINYDNSLFQIDNSLQDYETICYLSENYNNIEIKVYNDLNVVLDTFINTEIDLNNSYDFETHNSVYIENKDSWDKLFHILSRYECIYVVREGSMLSFNPFLFDDNKLNLKFLHSFSSLSKFGNPYPINSNKIALLGGPYFPKDSLSNIGFSYNRNNTNGMYLNLPSTLKEIDSIDYLINHSSNLEYETNVYVGSELSKKNIYTISYPEIIHFASHSYKNENNETIGLVLSYNEKHDSVEYILAEEIEKLQLSGCILAIISACSSGGESQNLSIQSSLFNAGVENIIVSLWDIDDDKTSELMIKFYEHYLQTNRLLTAFNYAKDYISAKYQNDYYSDSFILISSNRYPNFQ